MGDKEIVKLEDFENKKEKDFYQKWRKKVRDWAKSEGSSQKWAEYILLAPDLFHLLVKLMGDSDISRVSKVKIAGTIAYFIMPIDLLPEAFLGPVGLMDDVALAVYVLNEVINKSGAEVVKRHWAGEEDILEVIQKTLKAGNKFLTLAWDKLVGWLDDWTKDHKEEGN